MVKPKGHKEQCKCFACTGIQYNQGLKWSGMKGKKQTYKSKQLISKNNAKYWLGKKLSEAHKESLKKAYKPGKRIKIGLGSYWKAHRWVLKQMGKPMICSHCFNVNAKRYDWANISGNYKHELSDWRRLCVKCHINLDRHGELPCL